MRRFRKFIPALGLVSVMATTPVTYASDAQDVVLAFGGDVHFTGQVARQLNPRGLATFPMLFKDADISMVNLETSLGQHGKPEIKKFTFRTSTRAVSALAKRGIDVVTMANNHGMDYGRPGLADTLNFRKKSPIPILGVGVHVWDALKPWRVHVKGQKFAFFSFVGLDLEDQTMFSWPASSQRDGMLTWRDHRRLILDAIRSAKVHGETVVVYVHWGTERMECPNAQQTDIANSLVDAGADIIVGAHPHVLQGVGFVGSSLVSYSLGNFVWYSGAGTSTAVLRVTVRDGKPFSYHMSPAVYGADGVPHLVRGTKKKEIAQLIETRTQCARLKPKPSD